MFINIYILKTPNPIPLKEELFMASYNSLSSISNIKSNIYLTFPLNNLLRSSKSVSIVIIGVLFGKAKFPISQYVTVALVTGGILLFNMAKEDFGTDGVEYMGWIIGIAGLLGDGFLADEQRKVKKLDAGPYHMMETCNKFAFLLAVGYAVVAGEALIVYEFYTQSLSALMDVVICAFLGAIGNIFIYDVISNFSPVFLSIMTSSRKFFSILLSILIFGH